MTEYSDDEAKSSSHNEGTEDGRHSRTRSSTDASSERRKEDRRRRFQGAPGTEIGNYRIIRELGSGGMGVVFLAESANPSRQVALKLLRFETSSRKLKIRFAAEREALARLQHPNIARLYDTGETIEGRSYFAMEYVDGEPITAYCDYHHLTLRARLLLFKSVCDAVQHAHQKGLLHRDLKPSNILVAEIDGNATPKIIDFGIAKSIDQPLVDGTLVTGDRILGTPAYMSPESFSSETAIDLDTRTDVYSLGIVLYELLIGSRPFSSEGKSVVTLIREIVEDGAPRPSQHLLQMNASTSGVVASTRDTDFVPLQRSLAGDLDWIVAKAVAIDREERYPSAAALAADIVCHLAYEPVSAGPPSVKYRFSKLIRRHRGVAIASLLSILALVLGSIGTTVGMIRADREAENARHALREAEEVSTFLRELFELSDPSKQGEALTALDLLEQGATRIRTSLADQPEARARFMVTIGDIDVELGYYEEAEALLEEALEIRRQLFDGDSDEIIDTLHTLGVLNWHQAHYEESEGYYLEALNALEGREGVEVVRADLLHNLGAGKAAVGANDEALVYYERAKEIRERVLGPEHLDLAKSYNALSILAINRHDNELAGEMLERAISIRERELGGDHLHLAPIFNNLSIVRRRERRYDEAQAAIERAVRIWEGALGPEHPQLIAAIGTLASVERSQGRFDDAEKHYLQSIEIGEAVLEPSHPALARAYNAVGIFYMFQERYAEAESIFGKTLEYRLASVGPDHRWTGATTTNVGLVNWRLGRLEEAEEHLLLSISILRAAVAADHRYFAWAYHGLAGVSSELGRDAEAQEHFERSLAIRESYLEPDHDDFPILYRDWADHHRRYGRISEAEALEARIPDPS